MMNVLPGSQIREPSGNTYGVVEAGEDLMLGDYVDVGNTGVAYKLKSGKVEMPVGVMIESVKKGKVGLVMLAGSLAARDLAKAERSRINSGIVTPGPEEALKEVIAKNPRK